MSQNLKQSDENKVSQCIEPTVIEQLYDEKDISYLKQFDKIAFDTCSEWKLSRYFFDESITVESRVGKYGVIIARATATITNNQLATPEHLFSFLLKDWRMFYYLTQRSEIRLRHVINDVKRIIEAIVSPNAFIPYPRNHLYYEIFALCNCKNGINFNSKKSSSNSKLIAIHRAVEKTDKYYSKPSIDQSRPTFYPSGYALEYISETESKLVITVEYDQFHINGTRIHGDSIAKCTEFAFEMCQRLKKQLEFVGSYAAASHQSIPMLCYGSGAYSELENELKNLKKQYEEQLIYTKHLQNVIAKQAQHNLQQFNYHSSFQKIITNTIQQTIAVSKKSKHKKYNKKNQKLKAIENGIIDMSYFKPYYQAQKYIEISRQLTEEILPEISSECIGNLYNWIDKTIALQYNDGEIDKSNGKPMVIDLDLHSKNNSENLYAIVRQIPLKDRVNYEFKMDNKIYTKTEIMKLKLLVPKSSRMKKSFKIKLNYSNIINETLRINKSFECKIKKCDWKCVPVFKEINNRQRMTLSITQHQLWNKILDIKEIKLVPILMFKGINHWIENILIVEIERNISIGISLSYDNIKGIQITGIHLNKNEIYKKHEIIGICKGGKCNCLNNFNSIINDIFIGDPNTLMNQMKRYKKKCEQMTPLMYTLINAKNWKEYQSVQNDAIILMKHENGDLGRCLLSKPSLPTQPIQNNSMQIYDNNQPYFQPYFQPYLYNNN